MPKKINNIFYKKLTFIKLYEAHLRASKNKRNRKDVLIFEYNLENNLINLYKSIKNKTYRMGNYRKFIIYEPKMRLIESLPYIDRIVHQWYVEEFIIPYIVPKFIKDSYSCIKDRGTHKAVLMLQKYMRIMKRKKGKYYILKCDIRKYFPSINKDILYKIMCKYFKDKDLLLFTKYLIYDDNDKCSIPIGNYTSQFYANIYLNELDHYIKEVLRVKYYIRYMDDFVILVDKKDDAKDLLNKISLFLNNKLKLVLNSKSRYFPNKLGIDFCGYKIYETHILVRKRSKRKIRKIIRKANNDYLLGTFNYKAFESHYNSWLAHVSHANSYNLVNKYNKNFLFNMTIS